MAGPATTYVLGGRDFLFACEGAGEEGHDVLHAREGDDFLPGDAGAGAPYGGSGKDFLVDGESSGAPDIPYRVGTATTLSVRAPGLA